MLCKNSPKTPDRVVWVAIRDNPSFDKLIVGLLANNSLPELCLTTFSLDCKNGDTFLKLAGITLSKSKVSIYESVSYLNKCEADWSNNCSCRAYSSFKVSGGTTGCLMWFLDLNEVGKDHEYDVMPGSSSTEKKRRIAILVVSIFAAIFILALIFYIIWKKTQTKVVHFTGQKNGMEDLEVTFFDLSTIRIATKNFSEENLIGAGGFGPVYKGKLCGEEIAVKMLSENSRQDPKKAALLTWQKRFDIVLGIVRGLLYLHQDSKVQIVHRDLKASNILLDDDLNPKISDFGLARIFSVDDEVIKTNRIIGTYGYMSPEYAINGKFSVKSDVFSFGVLLLEIVSGKRNRGFSHPDHHCNLLGHAWLLWNESRALELLDPCLQYSFVESEVLQCIHIGLLCVQQFAENRPAMSSVVLMLANLGATLPQPKQPGFFTEGRCVDTEAKSTMLEPSNVNSLTITVLQGR
ncbi:Receptor protein kinase [Melia azedarach]|uniref:Receptor protein kinase n=1 Tax=Melia azedarach TaxID=155640 RepID=A0ACC1YR10_MELAZ|nr:Receptor protein kinase [Melia azedarach]